MQGTDAGFFLELSEALQKHSAAQIRAEAKAYAELRDLFPGKTMPQIVSTVRSWHKKERLSPDVIAQRIEALLAQRSDESVGEVLKDVQGLQKTGLSKALKLLGFAVPGDKEALQTILVSYVQSGGREKPPTLQEMADRAAEPYVARARQHLNRVDTRGAEAIRAVAKEVYALKGAEAAPTFAAFGRALGCDLKGGKAQMRRTFDRYVEDLARLHEQSRS